MFLELVLPDGRDMVVELMGVPFSVECFGLQFADLSVRDIRTMYH